MGVFGGGGWFLGNRQTQTGLVQYSGVIVWTGHGITHPGAADGLGHRRGALPRL